MILPRATYRLQLAPPLGFREAAALVPYLARLGISHLYLSPCMQATPGSTHGYDVVDPGTVSAELGGEEGFEALVATARAAGLGLLVDIVPNHMSIAGSENVWWLDVLENGAASLYADTFDVDWERGDDRILLPILGERYGRALAARTIHLARDGGRFWFTVPGHRLPVAPRSADGLLRRAAERLKHDELASLADALGALPPASSRDRAARRKRHRDKGVLAERIRELLDRAPEVAAEVDGVVAAIGNDPAELDALLERQNFRLAHWRAARSDLGYRRFFDVNTLVGLRTELPAVFAELHHVALDWLARGLIDGVRIDHPDGLRDPEEYFVRLRAAAPESWIVVEKILSPGEELPHTWPVDGTVGYEQLDRLGGLLVDPAGASGLVEIYERFTGERVDVSAAGRQARLDVLDDILHSELTRLVEIAARASAAATAYRDLTRRELEEALREILAGFPVYRTYLRPGQPVSAEDVARVGRAVEAALEARPTLDPDVVGFLRAVLRGEIVTPDATELVQRLQQTSGAVMAKGIEDTLSYRLPWFTARAEVGCDLARPALAPATVLAELARARPRGLIATATHDTKRGEDVRARLAVLSEIPREWGAAVERWRARSIRYREGNRDPVIEYLFWQTLVGAWPLPAERAQAYMEKAAREAKRLTSWGRPDEGYEQGLRRFVQAVYDDRELLADVGAFVDGIAPAAWRNSLTQLLLKLTVPGVPDLYQGTELWDDSLVDPDNRRPVDFERRRRLLDWCEGASLDEIVGAMATGAPKLYLVSRVLALRATEPGRWSGGLRALPVTGPHAERVIAFQRDEGMVVLAPRLAFAVTDWQTTEVELPEGDWSEVLVPGGAAHQGRVPLATFWASFPVTLLVRR